MKFVQMRKEATIVRIDILNMRGFKENAHVIEVALPVLAVECEATPPLENDLDAYEEAVLRLVALGLSTRGISKTLNATESLIEEILSHLQEKRYACRKRESPWKLTDDGEKYLNGEVEERASDEPMYGYMFVNAIKKEVLPFFYPGDVGQIDLFQGKSLPYKLTLGGDEAQTFSPIEIKQAKLKKAYKDYCRNCKVMGSFDADEISRLEAEDCFEALESLNEEWEEQEAGVGGLMVGELSGNMFIRALKKEPTKLYLRMRIVIDPKVPGGYRVESPFNYRGLDNSFFLRQIQWLERAESVYLADKPLRDFLQEEIHKISPLIQTAEKDFSVFLLERMPLLKLYPAKVPYVYDDLERIYSLMQRQTSLLEKENIVGHLARHVVEKLFNEYFRAVGSSKLKQIQDRAYDDIKTYGYVNYKKRICKKVDLQEDTLYWVKYKPLKSIVWRLNYTYGNSIMEKLINMLVIEDFPENDIQIHRFFSQNHKGQMNSMDQTYQLIDRLNRIRNKVSHDTNERLTVSEYDFYIANVFTLANGLLEGLREE